MLEKGMTLFVTIGLSDDVRHNAKKTIEILEKSETFTRVLSGDFKATVVKCGLALELIN